MQQSDFIPLFNYFQSAESSNANNKELKESFIDDIYETHNLDNENKFNKKLKIFEEVKESFNNFFLSDLFFIARAPGRVNIIGEHIDYAGFSVLPMTIENDILIACNFEKIQINNENVILLEIRHMKPDLYKSSIIEIDENNFNLEFIKPHTWINYIIAGFNSIIKGLNIDLNKLKSQKISKINFLVTGNIPCSSGLSSSSALTVASALATLKIFNLEKHFSKFEIANATINFERSVGTACGGMDQTISICGEKGKAKLIEFTPNLKARTVILPNNVSFIIANSLTESTKIDTLAFRYNKRVVENKLGLAIIAKKLNLNYVPEILIELKNNFPTKNNEITFSELEEIISKNLRNDEYKLDDISSELGGIDIINKILEKVPYYEEVLSKNDYFSLKNRLIHVCKESKRVENFYSICQSSKYSSEEERANNLGLLMNESHYSCKDLYECSSVELDKLIKFCEKNGVLGSRLTGAGWGGCAVIMVKNENLNEILENLKEYYVENFNLNFDDKKLNIDDYFFSTKASQGACLIINN